MQHDNQVKPEVRTERDSAGSRAATGSASWRLLDIGDKIEIGDQYLDHDCQTWRALSIHEWCIGDHYSSVFVPMRRRMPNAEVSHAAPPAASDKPTAQRGGVALH